MGAHFWVLFGRSKSSSAGRATRGLGQSPISLNQLLNSSLYKYCKHNY